MVIQVGYDNYVPADSVRAVGHPGPAPMTRLVAEAREKGLLIDFTAGRKCKAILITDSRHVILSAHSSDTIAARLRDAKARQLQQVLPEEQQPG